MENINVIDGLVSIIMPSWNTGKFITETIQSVINQTYTIGSFLLWMTVQQITRKK